MISTKKIIKFARKWQKVAAIRRKRISFPRTNSNANICQSTTSSTVADKGHFVVYTTDQRRFELPIEYLNNDIFRELLRISEEEFGLPRDGPITLPCDAVYTDYLVSLIQRRVSRDMEKALVLSMATSRCCSFSHSLHQEAQTKQQLLVFSF